MDERNTDDYVKIAFNSYAQMLHCTASLFNLEQITDIKPEGEATFLLPSRFLDNRHVAAIIDDCQKRDFSGNIEELASQFRSDASIRKEDLSPG